MNNDFYKKLLKCSIGILILAYLVYYLYLNRDKLELLDKISVWEVLSLQLFVLWLCVFTTIAIVFLIKSFDIRTDFLNMFLLHNFCLVLNYAPMKLGTVFRANYLKKHYGLSYHKFAAFFLYITFLMSAIACVVALMNLVIYYPISNKTVFMILAVLVFVILTSLFLLIFPVPGIFKKIRSIEYLVNARAQISSNPKNLFTASFCLGLSFVFTALRLFIVYRSLGIEIDFAGCLVLGALTFVTLFISITPGSLGIQEAILSFGAVVLNVPLEQGIMAALVDRSIILSYSFVIGGLSGLILWRRSPVDFKDELKKGRP